MNARRDPRPPEIMRRARCRAESRTASEAGVLTRGGRVTAHNGALRINPPRARRPVRAREARDQGVAVHVAHGSVLALRRGEPRRRARRDGGQDGRFDPGARSPIQRGAPIAAPTAPSPAAVRKRPRDRPHRESGRLPVPCATSRLGMPCELATVLGCVECFAQRMGAVDRAAHRRHWAERRIAMDRRPSTGAPLNRPAASFGPRAGQTADHAARTVVTGHRREVCRGRSARRSKAVVPVVRCANECRAALLARTVESRRRFKRAGLKSLRQRLDRTGCGRTRAQGRRGIAKPALSFGYAAARLSARSRRPIASVSEVTGNRSSPE
jgi:hypothetical protein